MSEMVKLKDIFLKPITGEWGEEPNGNNTVKIIKTNNIINTGDIDYTKITLRDIDSKKIKQKKLIFGDILIEKSGGTPKNPVGRVCFFDKGNDTYLTNNFMSTLRVINENCYHKYIFYSLFYLYKTRIVLNFQNKTTGISNLKLDRYLNTIKIFLPPFKEQKQIAKRLDKAKELIELRQDSISKLDELSKSIFIDMFGDPVGNPKKWNLEKLENFGVWIGGGTPSRKELNYFKGQIPWITTVSLNKLHIDKKDAVEFISEQAIKNSATKLIPVNSIIIGTRVGVGKVSINTEELCTNQDIISITNLKSFVNNIYVYHLIQYIKKILINEQRGATIQGITSKYLKSVNLPIPPLNLQNKFSNTIQKIEQQKSLYQEQLTKLQENFDALLNEGFSV